MTKADEFLRSIADANPTLSPEELLRPIFSQPTMLERLFDEDADAKPTLFEELFDD